MRVRESAPIHDYRQTWRIPRAHVPSVHQCSDDSVGAGNSPPLYDKSVYPKSSATTHKMDGSGVDTIEVLSGWVVGMAGRWRKDA
eukprot:m.133424 g.133424  ORF g.133424 m.133424 type:complete len:85 (-) comp11357_c0_seq3:234-488(-)